MLLLRNTFPLAPFEEFQSEFGRLFDAFRPGASETRRAFPALNIWETEDRLVAEAELPGLSLEDLEIFVVRNELTIKGRRSEQHDEKTIFHRRERGMGEFTRVLKLPFEIDADKVEATLKDGVLSLTLPKAPSALARRIAVRTA